MSEGFRAAALWQSLLLVACGGLLGCQSLTIRGQNPDLEYEQLDAPDIPLPTEKDKTTLPTYTIEPPDVVRLTLSGVEEGSALAQQVAGEHLVAPDGTINLGHFGSVYLTGLTLEAAQAAVAAHLSQAGPNLQVGLEVVAYNSKVYYVIVDDCCSGQRVLRLAATGNETVLDAVAQVPGLCNLQKKRIWISRPGASCNCDYLVFPVRWCEITRLAGTGSNYQVLPGDRVYIFDDSWWRPLQHLFGEP